MRRYGGTLLHLVLNRFHDFATVFVHFSFTSTTQNNEEARLITQRDGANRGARGRGGVSHGGRGGSAGGGGGSGVRHGEVDSGDDSDTR